MTHGIAQIVYGQCRYNKHTLSSGAKSLTNRGDSSMASPAILLLGGRERERWDAMKAPRIRSISGLVLDRERGGESESERECEG